MARRLSRRTLATYTADQLVSSGANQEKLVRQLAAYLVETRRTNEATLLVRDIEAALASRGHVLARVTTAHPLSDQLRSELSRQIKSDSGAESVEVESVVDPSLLGGVRVELPGLEFDGTLRRRIKALKSKTSEQ